MNPVPASVPRQAFPSPSRRWEVQVPTWPVAPISVCRAELWFRPNAPFIIVERQPAEKLQSCRQPDLAEAMLELTPSCCCQARVVLCLWRQPSTWTVCKVRKQELAKRSCAPGECNQPPWYRHWPCFVHCSENALDYLPLRKRFPAPSPQPALSR